MVESAQSQPPPSLGQGPVAAKPMQNAFSKNILKSVIGSERANNAFQSISMGNIP